MQLRDKVVIVTGGAAGIGRALCRRFARERAQAIVVADVDAAGAQTVANEVGGLAVACDAGRETDVAALVERTEGDFGRIDLFCANAGITIKGGEGLPNADWQRLWDVNVMSLVYAARYALPGMIERGEGYLLQTASAAALLTEIGSAPYTATKSAVLSLAEWLAIQHRDAGIRVSCLCPMGVETNMLDESDPVHQFLQMGAVSADDVAECVIEGLREERFLILPHPDVAEFARYKSSDVDRWLRGMQRLKRKLERRREAA